MCKKKKISVMHSNLSPFSELVTLAGGGLSYNVVLLSSACLFNVRTFIRRPVFVSALSL